MGSLYGRDGEWAGLIRWFEGSDPLPLIKTTQDNRPICQFYMMARKDTVPRFNFITPVEEWSEYGAVYLKKVTRAG